MGRNAQGFEETENERDGSVLIYIPAATFTMGSEGHEDEKPPHEVALDGFWMARCPVTNAQYRRFVAATGHRGAGSFERYASAWGDECPVVDVSWHDAVAYARWAGLRLPAESEWEYAARGPRGLTYPWGNDWDPQRCRSSVGGDWGSAERPLPVGAYPQGGSPFGCLDMVGNVWEWCASLYQPYPCRADDGRERAQSGDGEQRVVRGGSWFDCFLNRFRGSDRGKYRPGNSNDICGFRCARRA